MLKVQVMRVPLLPPLLGVRPPPPPGVWFRVEKTAGPPGSAAAASPGAAVGCTA